jgi:large subunit ribosomal protein L11
MRKENVAVDVRLLPKYIKKIYIKSQAADPSPPLGTILGNLGVNTSMFCTSFNIFTQKLPQYFILAVKIHIFDNKTTSFEVHLPSVGYCLNLCKFEKKIQVYEFGKIEEKLIFCITLSNILKIAKFKFPTFSLKQSFPIIFGSVKSAQLYVIKE